MVESSPKLKEECGIFGMYHMNMKGNCTRDIYYGLVALQHRGQESCGIAVNRDRTIYHHKNMGLASEVFDEEQIGKLDGYMGIGHVRYSTAGDSGIENSQPLVLNYVKGTLAMAHNGNIINADELRNEYARSGAIFQTSSDTEVIAYTIARQRLNTHSIEKAVQNAMDIIKGAYCLLVMSPNKMIAARDPWGLRPLCMGKVGDDIVFASESCAFDAIDAEYVREIKPGEIVVIENGQMHSLEEKATSRAKICIFEYIYFARPDSVIEGQLVYEARKIAGAILSKKMPVNADIVIGVPDSGIGAAIGYSEESKIPYEEGFIKNRYIGRTFIRPEQSVREIAVKLKLNTLKKCLEGKSVIMVDDSIVRGTTCARIVNQLRQAGAKEVHVRISSPPFLWPCFFGTDIPTREHLVSYKYSIEETRKLIGADTLSYLELEDLKELIPNATCDFCDACFSGKYPMPLEGKKL